MAQKYVLVPIGKTIDDLYKEPGLAYSYSDSNEDEQLDGCEWIANDTARIDSLYVADHPTPIEEPAEVIDIPAEK